MKSCLICGVGGQGTVLASRVMAQAAMQSGLFARTAETIGMAQRGGSVVSHVRFGTEVPSPLIPLGGADLLIGFEPGEAVRCLPYLKEDGRIIVTSHAIQPVTSSLSGSAYSGDRMIAFLKSQTDRITVVDGQAICAACGSAKILNTALLGAAVASGALGLSMEDVSTVLCDRLPERYRAVNLKALTMGAELMKGEPER